MVSLPLSAPQRDPRSHEHPHLFIPGSAVFPTPASANPTSTAAARRLHAVAAARVTLAG
jgi:choline dehydrogenase-like flavoprotein